MWCVHRLDEWANFRLPLCRGGRDEPHPLWAGVHRGHQPTHANPRDPQGGPREANRLSATSATPAHSHNSDAGAREDRGSRWGQKIPCTYTDAVRSTYIFHDPCDHHFYLTVSLLLTASAGDDGDPLFSRPRDLDLIQSVPPLDLLNMKAPPRVLTLTEQPLDSLETEQTASSQSNPSQAVRIKSRFSLCLLSISYYN